RSIKPRERDLGDLRLFFLARFFTRPTNHPRHAVCASNFKSKPVRPRSWENTNITGSPSLATFWTQAGRDSEPVAHSVVCSVRDGTLAVARLSSPTATPSL